MLTRLHIRHAWLAAIAMAFALPAPVVTAQTAINSIANSAALPLRNLQLEVRQLQNDDRQRSGTEGGATVQIGPQGQVGLQGQLQVQQRQVRQSGSAQQQVLVLNGRSARVSLGAVVPLRVLQTVVRNGQLLQTQGSVLLETGTGFTATPRWDGLGQVELEIAAQQMLGGPGALPGAMATAGAVSVVVVPLGEWTTVAQSEQADTSSRTGTPGSASSSALTRTELQVRVSAP